MPVLLPSQVHIWRASFSALTPRLGDLQDLLVPEERDRAAQYTPACERLRFVIGRGVLRSILGIYLELDPRCIPICYTVHGKPVVDSSCIHADIQFNLSHSGDWLACAVAHEQPVGIDVERMRADIDVEGIASYIFAPTEHRAFRTQPRNDKLRCLFNAWTHKEAYLKAIGTGLSTCLKTVSVSVRSDSSSATWISVGPVATSWRVQQVRVAIGYAAALVTEGPAPEVSYFEWSGAGGFATLDTAEESHHQTEHESKT